MKKIKYLILLLIVTILCGCATTVNPDQQAMCMKDNTRYEFVGNDNKTEVKMYMESNNTVLSDEICKQLSVIVKGYDPKDGTYTCDGKKFYGEYTREESLIDVIDDHKTKHDESCVIYGNDTEENSNIIVGKWNLEFTNGENKYDYQLTFNEDGTMQEYKVYGKSGEYVDDNEGVYSFNGENIYIIFKGDYNYSYSEDLTYNAEKGTIVDSNIRSEFPNEYTKE